MSLSWGDQSPSYDPWAGATPGNPAPAAPSTPTTTTPTTTAPVSFPTIAPNIQHSPIPAATLPSMTLNHNTLGSLPMTTTTAPSATPSANLEAYRNPFTQNVLDSAIRDIGDATKMRRNALGAEAFGAGAFGDARHGIESAQLTEDAMKTIGDVSGALNREGYESAMSWLDRDLQRQIDTSFGNAALDQNWFGQQMEAMRLGSDLDQLGLSNAMLLSDALMGLDQYDRGTEQADLDVGYQDWLDETFWGDNRLNQFLSIISGIPGQAGVSSSTSSPNTQWGNLLGASLANLRGSDGNRLFG